MAGLKKVLLIDDEKGFTDNIQKTFLPYRQEILFLVAGRADLGIEVALRERPNVIVLDLRMPGLSGEEALRKLKEQLPESKFIVVSAWNDGQNRERIVNEIGVDGYFEKPIALRNFMEKVLGYLSIPLKERKP